MVLRYYVAYVWVYLSWIHWLGFRLVAGLLFAWVFNFI